MSDRNMISLQSFPFPATKPNMMIKPKVFSIVFRLTNNYSMHVLRIKGTLTKHNSLSELEMLRGHCTQPLQLRRSHSDEDTYQILIENISNRAMKTNILNVLAAYPQDIHPVSTAEIVNGQVQWATCYATSSWQQVNTVLLLSREKEALSQLACGVPVEHEICNDLDNRHSSTSSSLDTSVSSEESARETRPVTPRRNNTNNTLLDNLHRDSTKP